MGFGQIRENLLLLRRDAGCRPIRNSEIALQARTILPKHRGCTEHELNSEGAAALHLHQATSKKKLIETDPADQVLSQVDG